VLPRFFEVVFVISGNVIEPTSQPEGHNGTFAVSFDKPALKG
jgi:hypothetical protein